MAQNDLQALLKQAKLRPTQGPREVARDVQLCGSSEEYKSMMQETFLEQYLEIIKDCSFKSALLPLAVKSAQSLVNAREVWLQRAAESKGGEVSSSALIDADPVLQELVASIDTLKQKHGWKYVFVRLSSLSPKDAALNSPRFMQVYEEELRVLEHDAQKSNNSVLNCKLHALYRASTWCLACENGKRACQLFIEADRTYNDLKDHANGNIPCDFNIAVREFRLFPVELEFRGFVYQRKLTALTQYNEMCFFPILSALHDQILARIQADFARLLGSVPLESFVVDFVLATKTESADGYEIANKRLELSIDEYQVWVVELNPFAEFAGAGLFDWLVDKPVLLGRKPFEFRFHKQLPDSLKVLANVTPSWKAKIGEH